MKKINIESVKKIKVIITDVDGVLNDGRRYFSKSGEVIKTFHVRDGMAVNILRRNNIPTIILTKEKSPVVKKWAKEMNVALVLLGVKRKEKTLPEICKRFKLKENEVAYIGDDVNDISLLRKVGLSACPQDSSYQVKKIVDYRCKTNGGYGALRELSDMVLLSKYGNKTIWY